MNTNSQGSLLGLEYYRSLLQTPTPHYQRSATQKTAENCHLPGQQHDKHAPLGAGLQFSKHHGPDTQQHMLHHAPETANHSLQQQQQQQSNARQQAAHDAQVQPSPLYQQGRPQPAPMSVDEVKLRQQLHKSTPVAVPLHYISNQHMTHTWTPATSHGSGQIPSSKQVQGSAQHLDLQQPRDVAKSLQRSSDGKHCLHHQSIHQPQQLNQQEDVLSDLELEDSMLALIDGYRNQPQKHQEQREQSVCHDQSQLDQLQGVRQQQQQPRQPSASAGLSAQQQHDRALLAATEHNARQAGARAGVSAPHAGMQHKQQPAGSIWRQQRDPPAAAEAFEQQRDPGEPLPFKHQKHSCVQDGKTITDPHAWRQQQMYGRSQQLVMSPAGSPAVSPAVKGDSCVTGLQPAAVVSMCSNKHPRMMNASAPRPRQHEQQQQAWQGFVQQERQHRQQHRQQALNVQVRAGCAQLLHRLSLFVRDDSSATAAASSAAGVLKGGTAAVKAAGSSNTRWPWLAAERKDAQGRSPGSPGYDPSTLNIPPPALSAMSDFNKQFWSIKSKCMDLVLFVRHGSFYNLFDIDADVGLRVGLNISGVMTANMWKVGCHKDHFAVWCAKVLAQGYSVGRVEEMPRSTTGGGRLLVRQLVRIYTPGTAVEGLMADDLDHKARTIMCITELGIRSSSSSGNLNDARSSSHKTSSKTSSRQLSPHEQPVLNDPMCSSSGTVIGLCVLDVSSGHCQAGTFCTADDPARSALAAALLMYDPVECISVRNSLHPATVALVARHCEFKGAAQGLGMDSISCGGGSELGARHIPGLSWLAPAAAAAVLQEPAQLLQQLLPGHTLQQLETVVQAGSRALHNALEQGRSSLAVLLAVSVAVVQLQRCSMSTTVLPTMEISAMEGLGKSSAHNPGGPMLLDDKAIISLDLLTNSSTGVPGVSKKPAAAAGPLSRAAPGCLLELLDHAASAAGRRTLQQWICRPLTQTSTIEQRLDVLDFFISAPNAAATLQQRLAALPDADRLLPKAAAALRSLQEQQQQIQPSYQPQQQDSTGSFGIMPMCAVDPADNVALETKKAAWRALINIPACLMGLVEALALLRGAVLQQQPTTTQLPLLHRALLAASKASRPAKALQGLLQGAQCTDTAAAGPTLGGSSMGSIQLAPGADAAYDDAMQQLHKSQQEQQQELQHTVAAYTGSGSDCVLEVLVGDEEQGILHLIVQPPAGAVGNQQGSGRQMHTGLHQLLESRAAEQLLLDNSHQVVGQQLLADSDVCRAGNTRPLTAAGSRGRGARGRARGHSSGRNREHAADAGSREGGGLLVVHVQVPLLQQLFMEVQKAAQQLELAAAGALQLAASAFLDSFAVFKSLVKAVSELDVLAGFAEYVQQGSSHPSCSFCRPRFAAAGAAAAAAGSEVAGAVSPILQLQGLWHPLLAVPAASVGGGAGVVCNDVQLGGGAPGAMLLTGANMGGKSTLLRSVCTAVIMAQIGCYVPASSALLEPVDAIYTRIGAADAIMCGLSTFMVEMSETAACLAAATPASLIVLDELGRGTSTHDGYALAYAVLKHLAAPGRPVPGQDRPGATAAPGVTVSPSAPAGSPGGCSGGRRPRLLFATHYHNLTCEPDLINHIQSCHMATEHAAAVGHLVHLYQLREGAAPAGSCGIEVAALAGLPSTVTQRATQVAAAVQKNYQLSK